MTTGSKKLVRVIACGAIAREILAICEAGGLEHIDLSCLPAILHNSPNEIPARVEQEIIAAKESGIENIFIAYADCGTGGLLDNICEKYGVERIAGPHCYSFFSGDEAFAAQGDDAMRSFYLTDFLARQFTSFVVKPLGLDRYPQLRDMYFGHYEKLVYLVQVEDPELDKKAQEAAEFLGLKFERRYTGYGDLTANLTQL